MYYIRVNQLKVLINEVKNKLPMEACGLLLSQKLKDRVYLNLLPTNGIFNTVTSFRIEQKCIDKIETQIRNTNLKICGCFHSHTFGPAKPSKQDINCQKKEGDIWLIYSDKFSDIKIYKWVSGSFTKSVCRIVQ